ncbi:MAG TPA: M48 family metalloprotease, partial [Nitrospirota bacterium]|nr:M48 family metalloprotease [Nitrospirota bacterium]
MRTLFVMTVLLVILYSVFPSNTGWAEQGAGWRERSPAEGKDTDAEARLVEEDVAAEIEFGREVAARIIGRYGLYQNTAVTKYVNLVGKVVAMNANRPELEFRFGVLNTDQVNAYAAPGGYVFVTRGALAKMQDEA